MTAVLAILRIIGTVLLELVKIVLRFFVTPPEQIPSKLIAIALAAAVGFMAGDFRGRHHERAIWKEREAEHAEAMEQLREHTAEAAREEVKEAQEKEQADAAANAKSIDTYAQTLPRSGAGSCALTDADLRAAGVSNNRNVNVRRNPGRLQRRPQASPAR
jgi:hypothetical protein